MQRVVVVLMVVLGEDYRKEKQDYQNGVAYLLAKLLMFIT
jgi:hypothetical protein